LTHFTSRMILCQRPPPGEEGEQEQEREQEREKEEEGEEEEVEEVEEEGRNIIEVFVRLERRVGSSFASAPCVLQLLHI